MATSSVVPGYIDLQEAASIIGVSHAQVWRYIDDEILDALKIGRTYLVRESDAKNFVRPPRGNPDFVKKSGKTKQKSRS